MIGLGLTHNWSVTEWSTDMYPTLRDQWGEFIAWWTGKGSKKQREEITGEDRTRRARDA